MKMDINFKAVIIVNLKKQSRIFFMLLRISEFIRLSGGFGTRPLQKHVGAFPADALNTDIKFQCKQGEGSN